MHQLTGGEVDWHEKDVWWHDLVADEAATCEPEVMDAEIHYLFYIPQVQQGNLKA